MTKNNERISVNALEKFCKHTCPDDTITLKFSVGDGEEISYVVKKRLSLEETLRFIESVVSQSIMAKDMMIVPVSKEFVLCKNILTYYANFSMPQNDSKAYDLVMCATEIIFDILNVIDKHQYSIIQSCIQERIEFEKQKMLCEQEAQIGKLVFEIEQFTNKMSGIFDGVNGEQMANFITNMSAMAQNTEVTAHDLADALVDKIQQ